MSDVKSVVHEVLKNVAEDQDLPAPDLQGDETLVDDLGFQSLTMARILAILEGRLGVDPFAQQVAVTSVRTVDDLCSAYEQCLAGDASPAEEDSSASEQSRQRAEARLQAARNRTRANE